MDDYYANTIGVGDVMYLIELANTTVLLRNLGSVNSELELAVFLGFCKSKKDKYIFILLESFFPEGLG